MIKYFEYRETIENNPDRVIIVPNYEKLPLTIKEGGSYAVAPARTLGLSYAEYLRFLKASFPDVVSIEGKGTLYPVVYWRKGKELYTFIDLLNGKMQLAVMEAR